MHRYFKKSRNDSTSSLSIATPNSTVNQDGINVASFEANSENIVSDPNAILNQERINIEVNPENIVSDPGLRSPIASYDVQIRDRIRREYVSKGPCQPKGHVFRKTSYGKEKRSFQAKWFEKHIWLEYSVEKEAAFCFWCYLFKPINANRFGDDVFVSTGFKNWKKALAIFREHEGSANSTHDQARILFEGFKNQRQSVDYNLRKYDKEDEVNYRIRLTASLDVIRLLLRQGLPFRGNDESFASTNKGNFLEILKWYCEHKEEVAAVTLENAPRNNQMTSPLIQKELSNCCAVETTKVILEDIENRKFSLLVDEARDSSIKEQMALVIRYVNNNGEIIERFLALVHVTDTTTKSLKEGIDSVFAKHALSLSRLRGQGYDGASNMRGEYNGLKTLILNENRSAKYIHCFAHQLQLVVVNVTKQHGAISDFFTIVTMIVNTCGTSCKRRDKLRQAEHEKIVKSLEREEIKSGRGLNQEMSLRRPGDTRWGSHFTTLLRLKGMWSSVIEVLENVYEDGTNPDNKGISKTLSMRLGSYDFVFILHLMIELLGSTNDLSKVLQLRDQNIVQAISLIDTTKRTLQDFRENGWN
ncbi:zinc finger MYM-type protein 1-like [Salvia hispanica]|uniref:zinc finger MYM-type protein 1-like n=1 Tax=Salvia hispanica TaxID=49212 RepID=UPI00200940C8|nr:zinc finger MYM-type protein 1-like [Salvia hispanica]